MTFNNASAFYFIILQLLWYCRSIYENLIVRKKRSEQSESHGPADALAKRYENEKRHLIHLFTTTPKNGRPVCYMDVYEILSPKEEEMLRHACAKGIPNNTYLKYNSNLSLPDKSISREKFTNIWVESVTLAL